MTSRLAALAVGAVLAASACLAVVRAQTQPAAEAPWRMFAGNWVVTGQLQTLPTESDTPAATLQASGAVVLTLGEGLGRGFRGEVIGFTDGQTPSVGRFSWTDERGDRVFGRLEGDMRTGGRFAGTITGGTGRYAGITGQYTFTWQYVVRAEEGVFEGRTVRLEGRFRKGPVQP